MSEMAILVGVLLVVIVTSLCALVVFLRDVRITRGASHHSQTDLTNMMILFQTMRDVVSQQKDLARQFNKSIDKKVKLVRDMMKAAEEERRSLQRAQHEIAQILETARTDLARLENQVAGLQAHVSKEGVAEEPAADHSQASQIAIPRPEPEKSPVRENDVEPLRAIPDDDVMEEEGDLIDSWTGFDFAGDEPEPDVYEVPESVGEEAEDAEAAREAFRALLDLEPAMDESSNNAGASVSEPSGNGHDPATPLQRRVYEYSDAGMTVPDIARELGVGKGEVRLILSLRQDKEA